jgi:uncharacterized Zn finger protein (UPF0148 family)
MEDKRCSVMIWDSGGWHRYQCTKHVKVERDGKFYCAIHDPEYIKLKDAKLKAKRQEKQCSKCGWDLKDYWCFCPHCGTSRAEGKTP